MARRLVTAGGTLPTSFSRPATPRARTRLVPAAKAAGPATDRFVGATRRAATVVRRGRASSSSPLLTLFSHIEQRHGPPLGHRRLGS